MLSLCVNALAYDIPKVSPPIYPQASSAERSYADADDVSCYVLLWNGRYLAPTNRVLCAIQGNDVNDEIVIEQFESNDYADDAGTSLFVRY